MYYKGTKEQCVAYNEEIKLRKNYQGTTTKWADIISNREETEFAIFKNNSFESEMKELETLPENWLVYIEPSE